jgi:BirA family biotin operon repressor/biotin-[acetyl-CoA-carboxylase] ligase
VNTLQIKNPFGAPVYCKDTVTSTMDEARSFTDEPSGTVIAAGEQTAGRGRSGRPWKMNREENLSFTVMFRYGEAAAIPLCLTLRTGLAVSRAVEDFAALVLGRPLSGRVQIKWPNDVMLLDGNGRGRKAVGILTEADEGTVYVGIGVNVAQEAFPPELAGKACSIVQALSEPADQGAAALMMVEKRFTLLELVLSRLYEELETADGNHRGTWREGLEERLYMKGQRVCFIPGLPEEISATASNAADSAPANTKADTPANPAKSANPEKIEGILQGISEDGEILITADSGETLSFITGELKVYT